MPEITIKEFNPETDRSENVAFYQRFGFEVTNEIPALGTQNFLMRRPAQP